MTMITLTLTVEEAEIVSELITKGQKFYIEKYQYCNSKVNEWLNIGDQVRKDILIQYLKKGE